MRGRCRPRSGHGTRRSERNTTHTLRRGSAKVALMYRTTVLFDWFQQPFALITLSISSRSRSAASIPSSSPKLSSSADPPPPAVAPRALEASKGGTVGSARREGILKPALTLSLAPPLAAALPVSMLPCLPPPAALPPRRSVIPLPALSEPLIPAERRLSPAGRLVVIPVPRERATDVDVEGEAP